MPTKGTRFGGRLFAVNLASLLVAGILVISEAIMGLVYGRISGKSGPVFSRTRSLPLRTEEGTMSGRMFGVERRRCVLGIPPFLIWL